MTLKRITDNEYYPWRKEKIKPKKYNSLDDCLENDYQFCTERLLNRQAQLEADLKAHNAVIREIKEGVEKLIGDDIYNVYEDWQDFWPKYLGGK